MPAVAPSIIAIIERGRCEGTRYFLPSEQLDRPTYTEVNKVLDGLGGKWDKKTRSHVFSLGEPGPLIEQLLETGQAISVKKDLQFFETPPALVKQLCDLAEIEDGMSVLEPSAGRGAIAVEAKKRTETGTVICYEIHAPFADHLRSLGFIPFNCDFLSIDPEFYVHRVVMNPPFTGGQDIAHVRHAFKFLAPGGILVSVMSPGWTFSETKRAVEFRAWLEDHDAEIIEVPEVTFKNSGTDIRTVIVKAVAK